MRLRVRNVVVGVSHLVHRPMSKNGVNVENGLNDEAMEIFALWMDEIGGLIVYLDHRIAELTELRAKHFYDLGATERLERGIEELEIVRDML